MTSATQHPDEGHRAAAPGQDWEIVRRLREPLAGALLVLTAIVVLVSAWQLCGLPVSR